MDEVSRRNHILKTFPQLEGITNESLREKTIVAWSTSMEENDVDDLEGLPWLPPEQERLGLGDEWLVDHVREVADGALALAENLNRHRGYDLDTDLVIAGALLHDVSKLYEFHRGRLTEIGDRVEHPYYGVHVTARAGLPTEIIAIIVNHTSSTSLQPASVEAAIISHADVVSATGIRGKDGRDLRDL